MSEAATPGDALEVPASSAEPAKTAIEETPAAPAAKPEAPWYEQQLDADLRSEPTLQRFKSVGELAKSYLEARSKLGSKGIIPPKEDATPEAWDEFYTALGRPESPEAYDLGDFQPPETVPWDGELQKEALTEMHKLGANQQQARGLIDWFAKRQEEAIGQVLAKQEETHETWAKDIAKKWGSAAPQKTEMAQRAFRTGLGEEMGQAIASARLPDGGLLGNHPAMLDLMAKIGETMSEHGLLGDKEPTRYAKTPEEAQGEIKKLKGDKEFMAAWSNTGHPDHDDAKARWFKLHEQAYPEESE